MRKLTDDQIVEIRELKRARASVRQISALTGASIGSISHYTNDIDPVRQSQQPVKRQMARAAPVSPRVHPSSYVAHVVIAPPSGRGLGTVTDAKPLVPAKPLTKIQKEQKEFKNRKGIDVSWVEKENKRRHAIQREEEREKKNTEYRINFAQNINEITRMMYERRKAKERENYDSIIASEQNGLTKEGFRTAIREVVETNKEEQHKICRAYGELCSIQNNEVYRVKKKQINDKFIADITPSVLGFVGDIVKSFVIVSKIPKSKPKIVMAQLVKEPMLAKVIKVKKA